MARKIKLPEGSPAFWPVEADGTELEAYVTSRLRGPDRGEVWTDVVPDEPAWVRAAFDASWSQVLAEADTW